MKRMYRLKRTLGTSYNTDPDDVWVTKKNLQNAGYLPETSYGRTPYPDDALFDGIARYQSDHGLKVDGEMRPDGETERHLIENGYPVANDWCKICGAPHGGVYSPDICWQCWNKGYR